MSTQESAAAEPRVRVTEGYDPTAGDMDAIRRISAKFGRFMTRYHAVIRKRRWLHVTYRIVLSVIAAVVILAGIAMLVLPGPGWLTIFLGLAILGSEFSWARRLLHWLRLQVANWWHRYRQWRRDRRAQKAARAHETSARERARGLHDIEVEQAD